jgi:outer membrane protein assembly factor BamA
MRFEGVLQLAGLTKFSAIIYYPNNTQNISIYPYTRADFKDLPTDIFDAGGRKIATYHNRSTSLAIGLGFSIGKNSDTKVEYNTEYMNVTPSVALRDSAMFPSWTDELHTFRIYSNLDKIDNVLRPYKGFLFKIDYEQGFTKISSDLDYTRLAFSMDFYHTFNDQHTIRLLAQYGYGNSELPVYKFHYISGPDGFIGMELHEFGYYRTSFFRVDYQYRFNKNLHGKIIYNLSPNYGGDFYPIEKDAIQGYGLGIKYMTAFGPLELIYGMGDHIMQPGMKSVYYFSMGYNL